MVQRIIFKSLGQYRQYYVIPAVILLQVDSQSLASFQISLTLIVILMPSIFPLEIKETILDFLAEDDKDDKEDEGHSALKTCSLVCQAFLHICRKHIFRRIVLGPSTTHAFERLLRETPEIADYIRKLVYNIQNVSPSIQDSLKRISRLEFLKIWDNDWPRLSWSNYPIRPALLHLLHLPTLTHFEVTNINDFVVSDLIPCVNLKYLDIGYNISVADKNTFPAALPEHSIQPNEFVVGIGTSSAIMKLCTAQRPDGQPIIDFGSLSKIRADFEEPDGCMASQELFRRCHSLTDAHISCK